MRAKVEDGRKLKLKMKGQLTEVGKLDKRNLKGRDREMKLKEMEVRARRDAGAP